MMRRAFTLVELSIVLLVVALVVGAVVAGQKLVQGARLTAVINEFSAIETAIAGFELEYGQFPGTFDDAFGVWGSDCAASAGLCNGVGDRTGLISENPRSGDVAKLFNHLGLSSFYPRIEPLSIAAGLGALPPALVDAYYAPSEFARGARFIVWAPDATVYGVTSNPPQITLGRLAASDIVPQSSLFQPVDAYKIDRKVDDGVASLGRYIGYNAASGTGCVVAVSGGTLANPDIDSAAGDVDYNVTATNPVCVLSVLLQAGL